MKIETPSLPKVARDLVQLSKNNGARNLARNFFYLVTNDELVNDRRQGKIPLQKTRDNETFEINFHHSKLITDANKIEIIKDSKALKEELKLYIEEIKDILKIFQKGSEDIFDESIKSPHSMIKEDLLKNLDWVEKRKLEDLFYILAIEYQRDPEIRSILGEDEKEISNKGDILYSIHAIIRDERVEFFRSNLGVHVVKND